MSCLGLPAPLGAWSWEFISTSKLLVLTRQEEDPSYSPRKLEHLDHVPRTHWWSSADQWCKQDGHYSQGTCNTEYQHCLYLGDLLGWQWYHQGVQLHLLLVGPVSGQAKEVWCWLCCEELTCCSHWNSHRSNRKNHCSPLVNIFWPFISPQHLWSNTLFYILGQGSVLWRTGWYNIQDT